MLSVERPKIGFLGLMQGLYDKSQPELPKMQEKFALEVVEQLKDVADVDFPGPAGSPPEKICQRADHQRRNSADFTQTVLKERKRRR